MNLAGRAATAHRTSFGKCGQVPSTVLSFEGRERCWSFCHIVSLWQFQEDEGAELAVNGASAVCTQLHRPATVEVLGEPKR